MKNRYFVVLTGLLLSLAFPPLIFNNLVFIAFLPLLFLLHNNTLNFTTLKNNSVDDNSSNFKNKMKNKGYFLPLYLTFFVYHLGANWWIGSFQEQTDPYLLMSAILLSIFHPFFFMFPIKIYQILVKQLTKKNINENSKPNISYLYLFPFIWVVFEWLHGETELSYPWLTVGYTQITNTNWIQFIDITGIWGASFVILMVNVIIFDLINRFIEIEKNNVLKLSDKLKQLFTTFKIQTITLILLLILPILYSQYQKNEYNNIIDETLKVNKEKNILNNKFINFGIIQPSINPWEKWSGKGSEQILTHIKLQDSLRNYLIAKNEKIDIFIWSETAIPFINMEVNAEKNLGFIYNDIIDKKYSLLTGYTDIKLFKPNEERTVTAKPFVDNLYYESYNSAYLINEIDFDNLTNGIISLKDFSKNIYHKSKLTPFAERLPHVEMFSFAKQWFEWGVGISSWGKGTKQIALKFENNGKNSKIAPIICIESIYPRFVSNFASLGADIFVVITNDAWYDGTPGPRQHYLIAAARAIENKRFLVRCGNSGISGVISPLGNSLIELEPQTKAALSYKVPSNNKITIYTAQKDWLPITNILLIIITFIFFKYKNNI
jgi:apolipoprotein N-acyltransferase